MEPDTLDNARFHGETYRLDPIRVQGHPGPPIWLCRGTARLIFASPVGVSVDMTWAANRSTNRGLI